MLLSSLSMLLLDYPLWGFQMNVLQDILPEFNQAVLRNRPFAPTILIGSQLYLFSWPFEYKTLMDFWKKLKSRK